MIFAIIFVLMFLIAVVVHEVSHGLVADIMGDPTPRFAGRLTLNPLAHMDPIGTLMPILLILFGTPMIFGWAKPVPINPYNFKDPVKGEILVSLAGPLSNLLLAFIVSRLIGIVPATINLDRTFISFVSYFINLNIGLAVFNLLPIPPLDGSHILENFLPAEVRQILEQYGFFILIFILFNPATSHILFSIIDSISYLMTNGL